MKYNLLIILFLISGLVFLNSCSEDEEDKDVVHNYEEEDEELYEYEAFPLKDYELPFYIYLPDETADIGAATKPVVTHEMSGYKWQIKLGQRFILEIIDMGEMNGVDIHKEELEDLAHIFEVEYLVEDDDFIYYKRKVNQAASDGVGVDHVTYHCYANHNINGINYLVGSHEDGVPKPIAEYMVTSVKNVENIN